MRSNRTCVRRRGCFPGAWHFASHLFAPQALDHLSVCCIPFFLVRERGGRDRPLHKAPRRSHRSGIGRNRCASDGGAQGVPLRRDSDVVVTQCNIRLALRAADRKKKKTPYAEKLIQPEKRKGISTNEWNSVHKLCKLPDASTTYASNSSSSPRYCYCMTDVYLSGTDSYSGGKSGYIF